MLGSQPCSGQHANSLNLDERSIKFQQTSRCSRAERKSHFRKTWSSPELFLTQTVTTCAWRCVLFATDLECVPYSLVRCNMHMVVYRLVSNLVSPRMHLRLEYCTSLDRYSVWPCPSKRRDTETHYHRCRRFSFFVCVHSSTTRFTKSNVR